MTIIASERVGMKVDDWQDDWVMDWAVWWRGVGLGVGVGRFIDRELVGGGAENDLDSRKRREELED